MTSLMTSLTSSKARSDMFFCESARIRLTTLEARLALLEVFESPSIFLRDMAGSRIPVAVAHGEGRVSFPYSCSPSSRCNFPT